MVSRAQRRYRLAKGDPVEETVGTLPKASPIRPLFGLRRYRGQHVRGAHQHVRQPVPRAVPGEAEEPRRSGHEDALRGVEREVRGHGQDLERAEFVGGDQALACPRSAVDARDARRPRRIVQTE